MRNLKRALSLGLTAAMISGLMVMGTSTASYADVADTDNVEAIEVLEAVGIMIGDENGDFNPDQNVTRNEMAVVMSNLMEYNVASYANTSPFTDVPSWAEPYVAACWTNGITAGTSATTYGGSDSVTTAQAALMLMKALGYFQYSSDFGADWQLSTVRQGNAIDLFIGVDSGVEQAMTRNDVAQLVLNTLEAGTVQAESNGSLTVGNVTIATDVQYNYVTSNQAYASSIDNDRRTNNDGDLVSGYIVELGEQLYMGDLELNDDDIDDFGRPSRTWIYDGQDVGTYAKKELLKASYTTEVEGGDIYGDIGSAACDYKLAYWVDGEKLPSDDTDDEAAKLERRNDDPMRTTGNGVLTEVYVDADAEETTIVEIHTYLAEAANDYSETSGLLTITIYTGRNDISGEEITISRRLEVEDLPEIANYSEGDFMMVTMADGEVKSIADPEVVSGVTITAYSADSDDGEVNTPSRLTSVTTDDNPDPYDISEEAYYDSEWLFDYNTLRQQMYEHTYDLMLDSYGYLLGIENVTDNTNSFFIVGYTPRAVNWGDAIDDAYVIFPDGRMEEVKAMERDGVAAVPDSEHVNAWYDYSINEDGVYEIHGLTENQFITVAETEISANHDTLDAQWRVDLGRNNGADWVYGGDDSVYITVDKDSANRIDEVNSVITGLRNANIDVSAADTVPCYAVDQTWNGTVFGLFDSKGYVTHAIVLGEGGNDYLVYLVSGIKRAEQRGSVTYYGYDAILPGSDEITRVWTKNLTTAFDDPNGDGIGNYVQMAAHNLYEATYDADGNITEMDLKYDTATFNTDAYETNGYGMLTINAGNPDQAFIENGTRTLRFPNAANNDRYVLLAPDCLFFVNGQDDGDNDYDVYSSMSAALTALGTNAAGEHPLSATATGFARFVVITNENGQATTVIFYDREYEDVGTPGGTPNGVTSFVATSSASQEIDATLTLDANASGSAVFELQWSLDNGETWRTIQTKNVNIYNNVAQTAANSYQGDNSFTGVTSSAIMPVLYRVVADVTIDGVLTFEDVISTVTTCQ